MHLVMGLWQELADLGSHIPLRCPSIATYYSHGLHTRLLVIFSHMQRATPAQQQQQQQ
jgi:hypothetical protein